MAVSCIQGGEGRGGEGRGVALGVSCNDGYKGANVLEVLPL